MSRLLFEDNGAGRRGREREGEKEGHMENKKKKWKQTKRKWMLNRHETIQQRSDSAVLEIEPFRMNKCRIKQAGNGYSNRSNRNV